MGLFGSNDGRAEYEEVKQAYRDVKVDIDYASARVTSLLSQIGSIVAPKFEYLMLDDLDQAGLDQRGLNGWELVSAASYTVGFGLGGNERLKVHMRYVFKRPVGDLPPDVQAEVDQLVGLHRRKAELGSEIESRGDVAG